MLCSPLFMSESNIDKTIFPYSNEDPPPLLWILAGSPAIHIALGLVCIFFLLTASPDRYHLCVNHRRQCMLLVLMESSQFSTRVVLVRPPRLAFVLYLKRARQRPITSPWQTSSALNSEPSRVR